MLSSSRSNLFSSYSTGNSSTPPLFVPPRPQTDELKAELILLLPAHIRNILGHLASNTRVLQAGRLDLTVSPGDSEIFVAIIHPNYTGEFRVAGMRAILPGFTNSDLVNPPIRHIDQMMKIPDFADTLLRIVSDNSLDPALQLCTTNISAVVDEHGTTATVKRLNRNRLVHFDVFKIEENYFKWHSGSSRDLVNMAKK